MERTPELDSSKQLDCLQESEIRSLLEFCDDEKRIQLLEMLRESNTSLMAKINENANKLAELKKINLLLLERTWDFIDEEERKNAASFFKELGEKFRK